MPPYLSADEEAKARFIHEAKTASSPGHLNIGYIHENGETDDVRRSAVTHHPVVDP